MRLSSLSPIALLLLIACGGGEPAKDPSTENPTPAPKAADPVPTPPPAVTASATAEPTPAPPPVEEPPALVFDGLKLTATKGKVKAIEVKSDGTVSADGKTIGSFAKNELRDDSGSPMFTVKKDGAIEGKDAKSLKFNDKDELVGDTGDKIIVGDDGAVKVEKSGKTENAPVKVAGVNGKNKRAAALLVSHVLWSAAPAKAATPPAAGGKTGAPASTGGAAPKAPAPKK